MLLTILKTMLVMTARAELMMMIKTGESAMLECEGAWKYCEWRNHEQVTRLTTTLPHASQSFCSNSLVTAL